MDRVFIQLALPLASVCLLGVSGCCGVGRGGADELTAAQNHAREIYAENLSLQAAELQAQQMMSGLESEKQMLMQHLTDVETQLQTANGRVENLIAERSELTDRYAKALTGDGSITVGAASGKSLEAAGFQYDPTTGLNKFRSDILFDLGSDVIRPEYQPILSEFASSVKSGAAAGMKILIVGHTDDQQIARPETIRKHPTNWHLSTDRSAAVIQVLTQLGVGSEKMASMGYSEFHPLEHSVQEPARQRNRRVELYVVPDDPHMAGRWDPVGAVR